MIKDESGIDNIKIDSLAAKLKLAANKLDDIDCNSLAKAVNEAMDMIKDLENKPVDRN